MTQVKSITIIENTGLGIAELWYIQDEIINAARFDDYRYADKLTIEGPKGKAVLQIEYND